MKISDQSDHISRKTSIFTFLLLSLLSHKVTILWGRISIELDIPLKRVKKDKNSSCLIKNCQVFMSKVIHASYQHTKDRQSYLKGQGAVHK